MATYNYEPDSSEDGWSVTYKMSWDYGQTQHDPNDAEYYTTIGNYSDNPTGASWYQHSWWVDYNTHGPQVWAKFYHNTSGLDLKLTSMSFLTCACNSHNQGYMAGGGYIGTPTEGYGVTFRARYYVSGNSGVAWCDEEYRVPDLLSSQTTALADCGNVARYKNEYGKSSDTINPHFGGCRSGYYVGDDDLPYYVKEPSYMGPNKAVMTFSNPLVIPNDGYVFLVVDITDWHGGSINNQTIVMLGDDPYFGGELEPDDKAYIWRMTDMGDGTREWQRTHFAFMWSGSEWVKMDEANADTISEIESKKS